MHQIKIAESFLTDYPRKEEVLAEFHRVVFEQLPVEQLQNANEESIAYLYTHCKNAGFLYSKVSVYYEMDQLLVSCNDFQKVLDVWNKLNANLDYRERHWFFLFYIRSKVQIICSLYFGTCLQSIKMLWFPLEISPFICATVYCSVDT